MSNDSNLYNPMITLHKDEARKEPIHIRPESIDMIDEAHTGRAILHFRNSTSGYGYIVAESRKEVYDMLYEEIS